MYTPEQVADSLKKMIQKSYGSMRDFSRVLGVSPSNLSNLVSGKTYLSPKNSFKIANHLGLNPRFLAYGEDPVSGFGLENQDTVRFSVKPIIFSTLNPSQDECELIELMLDKLHPRFVNSRVRIVFNDNENSRFEKMIAASLSLASRLIDLSLLDPMSMKNIIGVDHGDRVPIYKEYVHFIDGLLIKSNFRHTQGYIEFIVYPDFIEEHFIGQPL